MYPVLLNISVFTIYTYGVFVATGFIIGITVARIEAERHGENPEKIMDLSFYLIISGILGARLFYIFTEPRIQYKEALR